MCDCRLTRIRGFLRHGRPGKIGCRHLGHRLTSRSAATEIHGWSPLPDSPPAGLEAERRNNFCGWNEISTAAETFVEGFGWITGKSHRSYCTEADRLRLELTQSSPRTPTSVRVPPPRMY